MSKRVFFQLKPYVCHQFMDVLRSFIRVIVGRFGFIFKPIVFLGLVSMKPFIEPWPRPSQVPINRSWGFAFEELLDGHFS